MPDRVVKVVLRGDATSLVTAAKTGSKAVLDSARDMTAAGKEAEKFRGGLSALGDTAGAVGLTAGIGLGLVSKAAMDWESAWAGVNKTVDGTAEEMAELEAGLRDLARTLPATHGEIAAVAEAAGQLGVAREDIVSFTKTMIDLGETTNLTAEDAATSIAQMANVMGTSADEVDNFGAALVALGNDGASTEADILSMATRLSGAGKLIGASESDVLALANAMSSMGIEAELGGGAMGRTLTKMYSAVKSGGAQLEGFAKIAGMSGEAFTTAFGEDPIRAVDSFVQGLNRIDESGGNAVQALGDVGIEGTQDLSVLLRLKGAQDLLSGSLDLGAEAWAANSALAEEAGKRYDTTASKGQVAANQIKDSMIEFGDVALPVLAKVAEAAGGTADFMGSLPAPIQDAGVALLGLTAITGGALWFGSKVVNGVAKTRAALDDLGYSSDKTAGKLGKIGGTALGILAVGTAVGAIADGIGRIKSDDLDRALESLALGGDVTDDLEKVVENVGTLTSKLNSVDLGEVVTLGGLFGDTSLDRAADNIDQVDQKLASLVKTGESAAAAKMVERLQQLASEKDIDPSKVTKLFDAYALELENTQMAAEAAAAGSTDLAGATGLVGDAAEAAAEQVRENEEEIQKLRDTANETAREFFGLGGAVDDTKVSLDGWIQSLRDQAKALEDFTANAKTAAKKGLSEGLIAELEAAGPIGALRMKELANATKAEIAEANRAWKRGEKAMQAWVDFHVPPKDVEANIAPAVKSLNTLRTILNGFKGATFNLPPVAMPNYGPPKPPGYGGKDGDPKTPWWGGGYTGPGGRYEPAGAVHKGEVVWNQDDVAAHGGPAAVDGLRRTRNGYDGGGIVGGGLGNYIRNDLDLKMPRTLKQWERALEKSEKSIDREREQRDDLVSERDDLKSTITDFFRQDIFENDRPDSWSYMSTGARTKSLTQDPIKALEKSIREGAEYEKLLRSLTSKGLDGGAFQALAESGDLERVRAFAGQTAGQLGAYESLFNKNQLVSASAGNYTGNVVYSKQIAESNRELQIANGYHAQLGRKVDALEKAMDRAADKIARGRDRSRNRTAADIRLGRPT